MNWEGFAIQTALDVAAPDAASWEIGWAEYEAGNGLHSVLNAAAPDGESWLMGLGAYNGAMAASRNLWNAAGLTRGTGRRLGGLFREDQFSPAQRRRALG